MIRGGPKKGQETGWWWSKKRQVLAARKRVVPDWGLSTAQQRTLEVSARPSGPCHAVRPRHAAPLRPFHAT